MTPVELRDKGYQALVSQLGPLDAVRFLQQMGWGTGNYTQERQERIGTVTREAFLQSLQNIRDERREK